MKKRVNTPMNDDEGLPAEINAAAINRSAPPRQPFAVR
jgi:hypothetical protein